MKYFILSLFSFLLFTSQAQAWVMEADFEQGTLGEKADGPSGFTGGRALTVYSDEQSLSGSQSAKAGITKGSNGFKEWGGKMVFPTKLKEGDEVWYRVWIYYPANWVFGKGPKGLRIHLANSGGGNVGYFDYFINADNVRQASEIGTALKYPGGTCPYGINPDWGQFRCNMEKLGNPDRTDVNVTKGTWHAFEMYIKLHSVPGKAMYRAWFDGKPIFEDPLTATMVSSSDVSDFTYLFTTWNNGAPATQHNFVDDIMITNEIPGNKDSNGNPYIGTGAVTFKANPKPPTPQ